MIGAECVILLLFIWSGRFKIIQSYVFPFIQHKPNGHLQQGFVREMAVMKDVVCIGGGVGGLVTSSLLSRQGLKTCLIEKNDRCGGRMNSDTISVGNNTYRFDTGPSLLLLPDIYNKTFELIGARLEDHITMLKVEPFYRCYFQEDATFAEISSDANKMKHMIDNLGEPAATYDGFVDYMKTAGDFLRFGLPAVIEEKFGFEELRNLGPFLQSCLKSFPLNSHISMLKQFFGDNSPKMHAMMSFQDLYIGLSPYETPAVFSLLQALELENGR